MAERIISKILAKTLNVIAAGGAGGTISAEALAKETVDPGQTPASPTAISCRITRINQWLEGSGKKVIRTGTRRNPNGGYTVINVSETD